MQELVYHQLNFHCVCTVTRVISDACSMNSENSLYLIFFIQMFIIVTVYCILYTQNLHISDTMFLGVGDNKI